MGELFRVAIPSILTYDIGDCYWGSPVRQPTATGQLFILFIASGSLFDISSRNETQVSNGPRSTWTGIDL